MEFQSSLQKLQRSPYSTIPLSLELRRQPPGLFQILTRGPWPWGKEQREDGRPNPATVSAGGEGGGAWEVKKAKAHLWVALELERRAGDGVSTASGGDWSSATAAG